MALEVVSYRNCHLIMSASRADLFGQRPRRFSSPPTRDMRRMKAINELESQTPASTKKEVFAGMFPKLPRTSVDVLTHPISPADRNRTCICHLGGGRSVH
jgi:hypothetical protein